MAVEPGSTRTAPITGGTLASHHFGDVSSSYAAGRPQISARVVDLVLTATPQRPTVVEVGSGTGQLTRALLERCGCLVCVEPDDRLRAALAEVLPPGSAELVPHTFENAMLPQGGADLIVASGSWHWVDRLRGPDLAARALRADGSLALVWNFTDLTGSCRAVVYRDAFVGRYARFRTTRDRVRLVADRARRDLVASGRFRLAWSGVVIEEGTVPLSAYDELLRSYGCAKHLRPAELDVLSAAVSRAVGGSQALPLCTTSRVDVFRPEPPVDGTSPASG